VRALSFSTSRMEGMDYQVNTVYPKGWRCAHYHSVRTSKECVSMWLYMPVATRHVPIPAACYIESLKQSLFSVSTRRDPYAAITGNTASALSALVGTTGATTKVGGHGQAPALDGWRWAMSAFFLSRFAWATSSLAWSASS